MKKSGFPKRALKKSKPGWEIRLETQIKFTTKTNQINKTREKRLNILGQKEKSNERKNDNTTWGNKPASTKFTGSVKAANSITNKVVVGRPLSLSLSLSLQLSFNSILRRISYRNFPENLPQNKHWKEEMLMKTNEKYFPETRVRVFGWLVGFVLFYSQSTFFGLFNAELNFKQFSLV